MAKDNMVEDEVDIIRSMDKKKKKKKNETFFSIPGHAKRKPTSPL